MENMDRPFAMQMSVNESITNKQHLGTGYPFKVCR